MSKRLKLLLLLKITLLIVFGTVLPATATSQKVKVVLISVANPSEVFWSEVHGLATAAAKDLGINFEILYSNRDHLKAVALAKEVSQRPDKPDYVIVVGEKLIASASIPILTASGIKVFMFGSLSSAEKILIGKPREKYPNYIGKIAIDDYMAGYLTAEKMVKEALRLKLYDKSGQLNFLAFEGVRRTSFSSERVRGRDDLIKQYPQVNVLQSVPTQWLYADATRILPRLLTRYANSTIAGVWCANSALSRGSAAVLAASGKIPGVDFVTVGTDWDNDSIKSVNSGEVLTIAGGHVATVAWLMVLIHDYHNGIDFDSSVYLNKVTLMDKVSSGKFLHHFATKDWDIIDFNRYSKFENQSLSKYDFSFEAILSNL